MTPPQDSVSDVERLRAHIAEQIDHVEQRIADGQSMGAAIWRIALEDVVRENRAALAVPINKIGEDARRAEAALSVAENLVTYTEHKIGCAVYQRSYVGGFPECTCGVEAARQAVTAIRRLSTSTDKGVRSNGFL